MQAPPKPKLRGVIHQVAAVVALAAGGVLVATAPTARAAWAGAAFVASLVTLYTISAVYHRVHWEPAARAWMRRADHACIFVLIAGTYTPFGLLAVPPELGNKMLALAWGGAFVGVLVSLFWVKRPKWLVAVLCVALGWIGVPIWMDPRNVLDTTSVVLLLIGGAVYTLGAVFYALKRPRLWPETFGYHELFHAFTVIAAALHFFVVHTVMHLE
jgi:hemolysin III